MPFANELKIFVENLKTFSEWIDSRKIIDELEPKTTKKRHDIDLGTEKTQQTEKKYYLKLEFSISL